MLYSGDLNHLLILARNEDMLVKVIQVGPDDSRPGGIRTVMLSLKNSVLGDLFGMDVPPTNSIPN